jgi:hypothetical protein
MMTMMRMKSFVSITKDMLDPTNPELTYTVEDDEIIPASAQQNLQEYLDQLGPWQLVTT